MEVKGAATSRPKVSYSGKWDKFDRKGAGFEELALFSAGQQKQLVDALLPEDWGLPVGTGRYPLLESYCNNTFLR